MAPPHVHMLLDQLPAYFDSSTSIELVDHLCNKLKESGKVQGVSALIRSNNESDDEENSNESHQQTISGRNFMDMPMIQKSTQAPDLLDLMHDIIREVENLRIRAGIFDQYDNWQYLTKKLDMEQFLAFIYGLVSLAEYDPTKVTHRRLALSAARLYIVLLSTPGQKQTIAFNEYVLSKTFDVFQVIRQLRDPIYSEKFNVCAFSTAEENRLLLDYIPLLDDVQLLLRCMTLKNCESTKIQMIKSMTSLITFCAKHAWNRVEAEQLVDKIYSTMSVMCLPEHDAHDNCSTNISMILNKTAVLYTVEFKCAPAAFQVYNFFIRLLEQYPKDTAEVLTNFIKSILTNTPKVFQRPDSFAYLLDIAVKYELAIFSRCNVSIVDYLKAIETNVESSTRINIIEMVSRLATVDCIVDWELFQSEISKVPREIEMIRILYNKLLEKSNTVKQKAFQCLLRMLQNGNKIIKEIFHSAFYRPNADEDEINYLILNDVEELYQTAELELGISRNVLKFKKQSTNNTTSNKVPNTSRTLQVPIAAASHIEGLEIINDILKLLPNIIYEATLSPMSAMRRVALSCLECILELDRNRIDDPVFESIIIKLAKDPVMLMRRTTLNVLNKLIGLYPNYLPLIKLWSKCLLFFMDDVDQKLKESAMESLKTNVFDNMCRFEDSSTGKIFTPWMIVRTILVLGKINVLKAAVESWIQKSILTPKNLSIIESHIFTVNCSEAWIILSIIACKMKSRNPDVVIKTMCDILQQDTYNSPICLQYILSVIKSWLTDFTRAGLNHLFKILSDLLRTGSTNISLVSDIYSLCCMIKEKSDGTVSENWITSIRDSSAEYLLHYHSHYASMHMTNERYLISLLVYTESSTDLNDKPDQNILSILQKYLSQIASNEKLLSMQTDQNRKINVTIIVLARFGLRDGAVASTVVADFNKILLFKNINESIICTLITAFSDLCKRHTSLVDSSIKTVIGQLSSSYLTVRSVALNNLNELILQDYVKMRGGVLLNILKLIIDEDEHIGAQALYVIQQYVHSKNEKLLKVSLLECVYAFNNYLQYAERDMFPASEFSCETCDLAGSSEDSLRKRCAIYDFFAENIDDSSLLKLLKNVNKIHHQLSKGKYVECPQGVATLLDLLYVFTMMCKAYERDKLKMSKIGNTRNEEDTIEHQEDGPSASKKLKTAQAQIDKEIATTTEKMIAIYYSFQQEVLNYIQKVEPDKTEAANHRLNEFATAIASNFRSMVEFAKPMNFWRALMKATDDKQDPKQKSSKRKDLKRGSNTEINNLGSDEEEYMHEANDIGMKTKGKECVEWCMSWIAYAVKNWIFLGRQVHCRGWNSTLPQGDTIQSATKAVHNHRKTTAVQQQWNLRGNSNQFASFTIPGKIEKIAVPPSVGLRSAYPTAGASPTFKTEDPRQTGTESRATGRENPVPPASRRWVPPSLRPQHGLTEEARIDSIFRKVRGILNKLTPEKFQKLSDELLKLDLNSSKILNGVILLIFDKALDEPKYSSMYAQLCKRIEKELETDIDKNKSSTFLQILLNVCRDKFENRVQYSEKIINSESTLTDDLEEKKNVAKQKILGNVKFIGELYKLDMLAEPHLHKMLRSLFTNKSSSSTEKNCEDMECLAQLIRTCGKNLDTELGKQLMDQYFDRMEQYSLSSKFPPRIRFMLRDLIELRKNNWTPRKVALIEGPAPIQELNHDDDVLPPGLNHLRNRDRDYRNNDRSEQRDWISKFTLNLQHLNDGFNLLGVSSPSPLLPSYNQSSNGYGNRDHRDNGGGGGGGGGNYRMHNNRNNQNNYGNNMRYNKHSNNHHHHQGGGGGGSGGSIRDSSSGSHNSPYGNSNMMNNKDLAPRFKRNLMTPPQNPVEELQMRPTPNSLLFKANMNIKTQLPISSPMGVGGVSGGSKITYNPQSVNEFASPLTTRTLLSEQRNASQINSSAFSGGSNAGSSFDGSGVSGSSSMPNSVANNSQINNSAVGNNSNVMSSGRSAGGISNVNQNASSNTMGHHHHHQQQQHVSHGINPRSIAGTGMNTNNHHNNQLQYNQKHQYHHEDSQQHYYTQQHDHHGGPQQQRGYGVINGGSERSLMPHDGHSHNNRHYDSQAHSSTTSNVMSTTGPNTPASPANNLVQNEQMIIKQGSSEKLEKKNKKDKGPGKDEYLVRVAAFVSDVMLENIKQQIAEDEQQQHNINEIGSSKEPASNNEKNKAVQEIVIEVVDKQSNDKTTTEQEEGSEDEKRESLSETTSSLPDSSSFIDTAKQETGLDSQETPDFKTQQFEANETTAGEVGMEEKVDVGSETNKETNAVLSVDQEQIKENIIEQSSPVHEKGPSEEECRKPALMEELVDAFSALKIPEKFMRDAIIKILNEVLDRNEPFHTKTIEFLQVLRKEAKLSNSAVLESFKSVVNGISEKEKTIPKITTIIASLLARAVSVNLCKLTDISSYTDNGQHYPLFLLVLQHLHKQLGKPVLQEMFNKSKVNLMTSLPECDRNKERMAEILEDRNLSFIYPLLRVQSELWKQILLDDNPQHFYKWIKENVEAICYTDPGFITAVMTVLLKYISQESSKLEEERKRVDKEKEIFTKYCPVLHAFLHSNIDLQLIAIYAIQVYWYDIGYPKGVLLRWFQEMYEMSVIEEDAFLRYKEDVTDTYPGKGKALFQVNQWLTWLAEAEDEDDEEED